MPGHVASALYHMVEHGMDTYEENESRSDSKMPIFTHNPARIPKPATPLGNRTLQSTNSSFSEMYVLGEKIGEGGYGSVYKGHHVSKPEETVAVKVLRRSCQTEEQNILREMSILRLLSDVPHVIDLIDFYAVGNQMHSVQEFAAGGDLLDRIQDRYAKGLETYTEEAAREIASFLLHGIDEMHSRGVVHRDLKPENVLLKNKDEDAKFFICDFGLARVLSADENASLSDFAGTLTYMAPEVLNHEHVKHGKPVDMWSVGCILYLLLAGYLPFGEDETQAMNDKIRGGCFDFEDRVWEKVSREAKDLIRNLLKVDPDERWTAKEALHSDWFGRKSLATADLTDSVEKLMRYNARRKLKGACKAIFATHRMSSRLLFNSPTMKMRLMALQDISDSESESETMEPDHGRNLSINSHSNLKMRLMTLQDNSDSETESESMEPDDGRNLSINSRAQTLEEILESETESESTTHADTCKPFTIPEPGASLDVETLYNINVPFSKVYNIGEEIGEGDCIVYKCHHVAKPKETLAVKVFKRECPEDYENALREMSIVRRLHNIPSVIRLIDFYIEEKEMYSVQELVKGGDLLDHINRRFSRGMGAYTEKSVRGFARFLFKTIGEMHRHGVVHRDLRPENLLLKNENDITELVVCDFGFARILPADGAPVLFDLAGTLPYTAPEVLDHEYVKHGKPVDMWSAGCILYLLLGGYLPFGQNETPSMVDRILDGSFDFENESWATVSQEAKDLICNLLKVDPNERLTAEEALHSDWFIKASDERH